MLSSHTTQTTHISRPAETAAHAGVSVSALTPAISANWYSEFALAGILGRELAQPQSEMQ